MEELGRSRQNARFTWVERVAVDGDSTLELTRERGRWGWFLTRVQAVEERLVSSDWRRFARRGRLLRQLARKNREPHHLPVLEVGGVSGRLFVKMASLHGLPCTSPRALAWLERDHGLSRAEAALEVGWALSGLLDRTGALERGDDPEVTWQPIAISPERVVITPLCTLRVRGLEEPPMLPAARHVSVTGRLRGDPSYMSPEQAQGLAAQPTSEVFLAGVLMYELLAGRHPFQGRGAPSSVQLLSHIVFQDPAPLRVSPDAPWEARLSEIILRALQKHPADRFADPGALRRALAPLRADLERSRGTSFGPTARGDWLVSLDLNAALSWLRERLSEGDVPSVASLLDHRPDLAEAAPVRDYIWSYVGPELVERLASGEPLSASAWRLLGRIPDALPALDALALESGSKARAQRNRLVAAMRWSTT